MTLTLYLWMAPLTFLWVFMVWLWVCDGFAAESLVFGSSTCTFVTAIALLTRFL